MSFASAQNSSFSSEQLASPSETQPPAAKNVRAMYYIQATSDPSSLARLIQIFAKLSLVPDRVYADREWHGEQDVNVEFRLLQIDPAQAARLEHAFASVIGVKSVIAVIE